MQRIMMVILSAMVLTLFVNDVLTAKKDASQNHTGYEMKMMTVPLGENEKETWHIQLCREPDAASVFAAGELQRFIQKSSGTRLAIGRNDEQQSPFIRVGNIQNDVRLRDMLGPDRVGQLTADTHFLAKDDYFCITLSGNGILIAGSGGRGVCYGVYEFLERFLDYGFGMRDFEAEYISEAVVRRREIVIPADFVMVQGPRFPVRTLLTHWGPRGQYAALWGLRQRCNVIELYPDQMPDQLPDAMPDTGLLEPQGHHHRFFGTAINLALLYHDEHPEAFELDSVRRIREDGSRAPGRLTSSGSLCFGSPATVDLFASGIKEYARGNPGVKIVQLTVPDGGFYNYAERGGEYAPDACFCDTCRAELERIRAQRREGVYADWGEFVLKFRNAVMEKVTEEYPDLRAVSLAYINYSANPSEVRPHPNLLIWYTIHQGDWFIHDGVRTKQELERLQQWINAAEDPRQVTIWNAQARRRSYCDINPVFEEEAPLYLKHNLGGGSVRPGMPYSYFRARMLWNPDVPRESMVDDYLRRNYHAAADVMREIMKLIDSDYWRCKDTRAAAQRKCLELLDEAGRLAGDDADALKNVRVDEALIRETAFEEDSADDEF